MDRFKIILKKNLGRLPKTAGVYCFLEKNEVIYIGKAVNIKNRVKNHFSQPSYRDNLFIEKVDRVGFLETGSEIEALILEANLIKKYQPKYNVVWRDDKNYFYVAIAQNQNKIPYVFITHQPSSSSLRGAPPAGGATKQSKQTRLLRLRARNAAFVGPFVEGTALKKTLRFLRRAFPYYTTKKHPKNNCTYCYLGLCPGPLLFENPPPPEASAGLREYKKNIKKLVLILQGKRNAVLSSLKKEMKQLAKSKEFEKAGKIRDRTYALQQVMSHTRVINSGQEVVGKFSRGKISTTLSWQETEKILQEILRPSLRGVCDACLPAGRKQSINRIECYDVSNIQGKNATGSMAVFANGKPDKNEYRKFRIKLGDKPNDIAMLEEILQRRFMHSEWKYPEVILIDGGKAQLNVAIKVREQFHRIVPLVISIAKGRQELFIENRKEPVPLKSLPQEVYNLIKSLDDEAHHFAIAYHVTLRKKNFLQ